MSKVTEKVKEVLERVKGRADASDEATLTDTAPERQLTPEQAAEVQRRKDEAWKERVVPVAEEVKPKVTEEEAPSEKSSLLR